MELPAQLKPLDRLPGEDVAAYLARLGYAPLPDGEPGIEYRQDATDPARLWARRGSTGETLNARCRCAACGRIVQVGVVARTPGGEWRCIPCRGDADGPRRQVRMSLDERIVESLKRVKKRSGIELAAALGVEREAVTIALGSLKARGIIASDKGQYWLLGAR